jgi:hypothetical protein
MSESRRDGRIIHLYSAVPSGTFVLRGVYRGSDQGCTIHAFPAGSIAVATDLGGRFANCSIGSALLALQYEHPVVRQRQIWRSPGVKNDQIRISAWRDILDPVCDEIPKSLAPFFGGGILSTSAPTPCDTTFT